MPPRSKRARSPAAAEAAAPPKPAPGKKAATAADAADPNGALCQLFEELMYYEAKGGNRWAGKAYNKVLAVLRTQKKKVTAGSDVAHIDGVGKASVAKIDEFLKDGKVAHLEELKKTYGPLPETLKLVGSGKSSAAGGGAKKGGKGAAASVADAKPPSAADKKKIAAAAKAYGGLSVDKLKDLLRANRQPLSGPKSDLLQRCAEGKALGALPVCPLCGAGKLRWDAKTGVASCPGFMDDDVFQACFYKSGTVERTEWKETA